MELLDVNILVTGQWLVESFSPLFLQVAIQPQFILKKIKSLAVKNFTDSCRKMMSDDINRLFRMGMSTIYRWNQAERPQ